MLEALHSIHMSVLAKLQPSSVASACCCCRSAGIKKSCGDGGSSRITRLRLTQDPTATAAPGQRAVSAAGPRGVCRTSAGVARVGGPRNRAPRAARAPEVAVARAQRTRAAGGPCPGAGGGGDCIFKDLATGGQVADSFVSFREGFGRRSSGRPSSAAPRKRSPARRGDGSRQALELQEKMQHLQVEQQAEIAVLVAPQPTALVPWGGLLPW